MVDGVAASNFVVPRDARMGLDAAAAESIKGRATAKWRLAWRMAPAAIERLRANGQLKTLNRRLSALTQQVRPTYSHHRAVTQTFPCIIGSCAARCW